MCWRCLCDVVLCSRVGVALLSVMGCVDVVSVVECVGVVCVLGTERNKKERRGRLRHGIFFFFVVTEMETPVL